MNTPPTFSKVDADNILRRAAEIEGSEEASPVTPEELRSIAKEAGFGHQALERAIAEAQQASFAEIQRDPVRISGILVVFLSTARTIPVELSTEQLMRAIRLCAPYREGAAQVKLEVDHLTWRDRKGLRFTVTSGGGVTEISVVVARPMIRRGRWKRWVEDAADRLQDLVLMVGAQDPRGMGQARLPPG